MIDTVYRKKEKVIARNIAGEDLLVPVRGSLADMQKLFVLEGVGEFIWENLDGRKTVKDILGDLLGSFDGEREQVEKDLVEFVAGLKEADLIEEVSSDGLS